MRDREKDRTTKNLRRQGNVLLTLGCVKTYYGLACIVAPWRLIWNDRMGRWTISPWGAHMSPSLAFCWDPITKIMFKIRFGRSYGEACR